MINSTHFSLLNHTKNMGGLLKTHFYLKAKRKKYSSCNHWKSILKLCSRLRVCIFSLLFSPRGKKNIST